MDTLLVQTVLAALGALLGVILSVKVLEWWENR